MKLVKCLKCGWVMMEVTRAIASKEVARFNRYFKSLSKETQKDYYNGIKSSIKAYKNCMGCGGSYKKFRDAKPEECPIGATINPILKRDE